MPSTKVKRVLIDCSSTITCGFNSGIQRVVRNLCQQANVLNSDTPVIAVYGKQDKFVRAQSLWPKKPLPDWVSSFCKSRLAAFYRKTATSIHKRFPNRKFKKLFLPDHGSAGILKLPRLAIEIIQARYDLFRHPLQTIEIQKGDAILLADASWQIPNWECIEAAKLKGALVGNIIYDLIPLTHPEFFQAELVERFRSWFEQAAVQGDFFLCISENVAAQMREYLVSMGRQRASVERICVSFPLGADLRSVKSDEVNVEFKKLFGPQKADNPHLIVGTLEPRKNHTFVLDAFDKLWAKDSTERLCIAGRVGWNCDALVNRIRNHPLYNRNLFLFNDASDADIGYSYKNAKSVIMASHTEGFGLPIVESLVLGQTVFASDTPVHREVGRDYVHYFKIERGCDSLVELIEGIEDTKKVHFDRSRQCNSLQWSASFDAIVSHICSIFEDIDVVESVHKAA